MDPAPWSQPAEAGPSSYQAPAASNLMPFSQAPYDPSPNSQPTSIDLSSPQTSQHAFAGYQVKQEPGNGYGDSINVAPHVYTTPQPPPNSRGRGRGGGRPRGSRAAKPRGVDRSGLKRSSRTVQRYDSTSSLAGGPTKVTLKVKKTESSRKQSFLGEYDRELDENPSDPLAFEEQFILRVPRNIAEGSSGLREMIKGKGKGLEGIEFKFLDSRRAAFKFNGVTYASKLVDLPNIIESQKTFDSRHLFKVADISQMLVVDHPVKEESSITSAPLRVDDYIWPHGITPPMRHVRKRRFRQRISRRTIEVVEEQVEEMLRQDDEAESSTHDFVEIHPDPDISDQYYIDYVHGDGHHWPHNDGASEYDGSEAYHDPGSVAPSTGEWAEGDYDDGEGELFGDETDADGEEAFDQDLATALMEQMGDGSDRSGGSDDGLSASEDDDDGDVGGKSEDEDDEETTEKKAKIKQFTSEIKALEGAIEKKRAGFTKGNIIMEKRFQETIKGLEQDVRTKVEARQALLDEIEEATAEVQPVVTNDSPSGFNVGTPMVDEDVDMDDEDAVTSNAMTPAFTPLPPNASGVNTDTEEPAAGEDWGELFGEESEEEEEEAPGLADALGGNAVGEDEPDDEMSAMLRAELGGEEMPQEPNEDDFGDLLAQGLQDNPDEQAQMDATDALDSFAQFGGLEDAGTGFVEGGVGMRRMASGRLQTDGDEDDSASDSDSD